VSRVGAKLGPYELVAELGRGGMATLFLAQREGPANFSRQVAVKIVHQRLQEDASLIRMFLDEARTSARVQHPNVVHVEELGESDGVPYLVMEYVDGVALVDVMRAFALGERAMPIEIAVALCAQIADGLHGAHESTDENGIPLGIVHRDVSPHNVLLSSRGHVKLIDFGIARAKGRLTTTGRGELKGKTAYLTPEQIAGEPVDRRGDIFALGIVLWEMLTMRRLFYSKNEAATMMKVREARVEPPTKYRPEIGEALEHVVMVALAREREERFQTAYAFRRALLGALPKSWHVEPAQIASLVKEAAKDSLERRRAQVPEELRENTQLAPPPLIALRELESEIFIPTGRPSDEIPELESVIAQARASGEVNTEVIASLRLAGTFSLAGQLERASEILAAIEPLLAERPIAVRALATSLRGQVAAGNLALRLRAQREAFELFEEAGWPKHAARIAANLGDTYSRFGMYEDAERALVTALSRTRQLEMPSTEGWVLINLAHALLMQDRVAEAEAALAQALHIAETRGTVRFAIGVAIYRAALLCHNELWTAARAEAERARTLSIDREWKSGEAWALTHLARCALAVGDHAGALEASKNAFAVFESVGSLEENEGLLFVVRVRALEAAGQHAEAKRIQTLGQKRLEEIASQIDDLEWRRHFLYQVPEHAELMGS
jgi:serine/threonine protein kinase